MIVNLILLIVKDIVLVLVWRFEEDYVLFLKGFSFEYR